MKILIFIFLLSLTSCSISFQNISTHGTATDLVDEEQSATPKLNATLEIPAKVI